MGKIRLDIDSLAVTSFDPEGTEGPARGIIPLPDTYTCETAIVSCNYSACANYMSDCAYSCNCVTSTANVVFCPPV